MAGINRVTLLGNLGLDPESRLTKNDTIVCRFRLATSDHRKDATGNRVEHTEWHNVVAFGKTAANCIQFLRKGRPVFVEGKLRTRAWQDADGQTRHTTEIVASTVQFIGGKDSAKDASRELVHEEIESDVPFDTELEVGVINHR
jgi:single-strand DNA-binding protein